MEESAESESLIFLGAFPFPDEPFSCPETRICHDVGPGVETGTSKVRSWGPSIMA